LREGSRDEADIRALDAYRHSFRPAFDATMGALTELRRLEKTGRMKTVGAIVEKLNRQRIRLTQIQDIAGIRLTCADAPDQEFLAKYLSFKFEGAAVDDRRERPSHGYRAVHVIVSPGSDRMVEIQLRTQAQHRWAQVSEKLADLFGLEVKYGGGPDWAREALESYSAAVKTGEELERQHHRMLHDARDLRERTSDASTAADHEKLAEYASELESKVREQRVALALGLEDIASTIERLARSKRDR
jgi:ppGpp synthetase/RelA/SpoT-type nucleotidyltranferase